MKGLYIVTPGWDDTEKLLRITEQALQGGAALLQYRHKSADAALRQQQAEALLSLCRRYQRPFIINDYVDLCLALDADGIHVGGTDATNRQRARQRPIRPTGRFRWASGRRRSGKTDARRTQETF